MLYSESGVVMSNQFARSLACSIDLPLFAQNILDIKSNDLQDCCRLIHAAEMELQQYHSQSTQKDSSLRAPGYKGPKQREKLLERIYHELTTLPRLGDDDAIKLGVGGAMPKDGPRAERQAYFITGLPASGKSGIASKLADWTGAVILDSDYAKRKFPEYLKYTAGASLVHEESAQVTFYEQAQNLLGFCVSNDYNFVMPRIGNDICAVKDLAEKLQEFSYQCHLICVDLDRQKATTRAYSRYVSTHRYVPLSMIFDIFSNEPLLNYHKTRQMKPDYLHGYCQISTDVALGCKPVIMECDNMEFIREIF